MQAGFNEDEASTAEMAWVDAFEVWLESKPSQHTRKAYCAAWKSLLEQAQVKPWELEREDILRWVEGMLAVPGGTAMMAAHPGAGKQRGCSAKTLQLRLGAISSFYSRGLGKRGASNPAAGIALPGLEADRRLTEADREAFLSAIPTDTMKGKRDYALFLCYITTGRRNSEVRRMKYKNIILEEPRLQPDLGPQPSLEWGAGRKRRREACPARLWEALQDYLGEGPEEHRPEGHGPEDYIFTAWTGGRSTVKPLAPDTVCKLVKKYAKLAGLGSHITVERLRTKA